MRNLKALVISFLIIIVMVIALFLTLPEGSAFPVATRHTNVLGIVLLGIILIAALVAIGSYRSLKKRLQV